MPAGLVIYNDFDTIQIDENYTNMTMLSSGEMITVDQGGAGPLDEDPIYGDYLPFTPAFGEKVALHSSGVYSSLVGNYVYTNAPGTVYWYRFGPPPAPPANGGGFQVFNASGQCTFDSNRKVARVVGSMTGTINALPTQSFPAGRGYAVIHSRRGMRAYGKRYNIGQPDTYRVRIYVTTAARQNGSSIEFTEIMYSHYLSQGSDYYSGQLDAQVLDITGYLGN